MSALPRWATVAAVGLAVAAALPAGTATAAGSTVSVVPTAALTRPASFSAVSFLADNNGWAVGRVGEQFGTSGIDGLIEHWNGSTWTVQPTPVVRSSDEILTGIAMVGPADGWAIGSVDRYGYRNATPILLRWNGTAWSPSKAPSSSIPVAIAASGPADVWAVGGGVLQHYDGTRWRSMATPNSDATLTGVTVLTPSDAWVVGITPDSRGTYDRVFHPYSAHWNGSVWTRVNVPGPPDSDARLASVSASSPGDVWAVGRAAASAEDVGGAYIVHFTGTAWTRVSNPSQAQNDELTGVSALSSTRAWAVGHHDGYNDIGNAVWRTLIQRWNGESWTVIPSPNDSEADNSFSAVTFASTRAVWAVGADGEPLTVRIAA